MSVLLFDDFSAREKPLLQRLYPFHLRRVIRGARDAAHALTAFEKLVFPELKRVSGTLVPTAPTDASYEKYSWGTFMDFDSHVGDCACQVRPVMLLNILDEFRNNAAVIRKRFANLHEQLQQIVDQAALFHHELCNKNTLVHRLNNLSKREETLNSFYKKTGLIFWWNEWCDEGSSETSWAPVTPPSTPDLLPQGEQRRTGKKKAVSREGPPVWDVADFRLVCRFLVFSNILSRFKTCLRRPGGNFIYRVSPQRYFDAHIVRDGTELACRCVHGPERCTYRNRKDGPRLINEEMSAMQIWISQLSSSFMEVNCKLAGMPDAMTNVIRDATRVSARGIAAVPTFATIPSIRNTIVMSNAPIFLTVHRFCAQGYHSNFFRIEPDTESLPDVEATLTRDYIIGPDVNFRIKQVLPSSCDAVLSEPHVCLIANSIDGDNNALVELVMSDTHRGKTHSSHACDDNLEQIDKILGSKFNEVLLTFFAQHSDFPFEVPSEEGAEGERQIDPLAESFEKHGLRFMVDEHKSLRARAQELGTSYEAMHLFVPQHMFLERPRDVIARLKERTDAAQRVILPGFVDENAL
ncbi:hypothetical protein HDU87_006666 [Geranomyces variabilis]|uniref:Uncharacterized protein n=1 Tax=Geranomyces variabilis TaxID=109894 RepID=A0AAD5XN85_9FUNG|nr:hypothetical protein HDU87_006666 [Geranomyces variabilis]